MNTFSSERTAPGAKKCSNMRLLQHQLPGSLHYEHGPPPLETDECLDPQPFSIHSLYFEYLGGQLGPTDLKNAVHPNLQRLTTSLPR